MVNYYYLNLWEVTVLPMCTTYTGI